MKKISISLHDSSLNVIDEHNFTGLQTISDRTNYIVNSYEDLLDKILTTIDLDYEDWLCVADGMNGHWVDLNMRVSHDLSGILYTLFNGDMEEHGATCLDDMPDFPHHLTSDVKKTARALLNLTPVQAFAVTQVGLKFWRRYAESEHNPFNGENSQGSSDGPDNLVIFKAMFLALNAPNRSTLSIQLAGLVKQFSSYLHMIDKHWSEISADDDISHYNEAVQPWLWKYNNEIVVMGQHASEQHNNHKKLLNLEFVPLTVSPERHFRISNLGTIND